MQSDHALRELRYNDDFNVSRGSASCIAANASNVLQAIIFISRQYDVPYVLKKSYLEI